MNTESILRELELFWQKLCYFAGQFRDFARQIAADPSSVERGDLVMMCATLLIVRAVEEKAAEPADDAAGAPGTGRRRVPRAAARAAAGDVKSGRD